MIFSTLCPMEIFKEISACIESGLNAVVVTITDTTGGSPGKTGFKLLITEDGRSFGTVGGGAVENLAFEEAKKCLREGASKSMSVDLSEIDMECGGKTDLFFEFIPGRRNFVLFGGGHVGRALTEILLALGYEVHVFDNRPEAVELLSGRQGIHAVLGDYNDVTPIMETLKGAGYCFIATHGHEFDYSVLRQVLADGGDFKYLGLIGSARKVKITLRKITESGIEIPDFLYSPVGLNIGGDSAAEIAVSIAAEVIAVTRNAKVPHMRERLKNV